MPYSPNDGAFINSQQAADYQFKYRDSARINANKGVESHFFGKNKIQELLDQEGCVGLRVYYGAETSAGGALSPKLMMAGVTEAALRLPSETDPKILDLSRPCPPDCP